MARAIRAVTIERGKDPRDMALMASAAADLFTPSMSLDSSAFAGC